MATRSVIMDEHMRTIEVSVPTVECLLNDDHIVPVLSHYGGELADANIYRPAVGWSLERLCSLAAISTPILKPGTTCPDCGKERGVYGPCPTCGADAPLAWRSEKPGSEEDANMPGDGEHEDAAMPGD